ncbi:MAG: hypothetical protein PVI30_07635 [Myxococcales bacterium]|jgi:hypothetical protein
MSERAGAITWCMLLAALTLGVYAGTWDHGFVNFDDDVAIVNLELIRELSWSHLPDFFEPAVRRGLPEYMPLKNLSYAVDYALFGLNPTGFRLQQQLWYLASVLLFFFWVRSMLMEQATAGRIAPSPDRVALMAFAAAALFAVHPAHVESVTWLSGRKDVLSGAFVLAALLCARRRGPGWLLAALASTALALLSKPTAVILPGLFVAQDLVGSRSLRDLVRGRSLFYALALILCGGFTVFYVSFTEQYAAAGGEEMAAMAFTGPVWLRWGQQYAAFLGLSIMPAGLSPIVPPDLLDAQPGSPGALFGLALLGAMAVGGLWATVRRSPALLPIALFALPLLPIVLAPVWGQYVAARYLFHAVGGVCLALVMGWGWAAARAPRLSPLLSSVVVLVGLVWGALTLDYNATWRSSSTLWEGALRHYPRFTRLHDMAARAYGLEARPDEAIRVLAACLEVDPDYAPCLAQMGELLLSPKPEEGERMLRRVLPRDPTGRAARALSVHLLRTDRGEEALALYERALDGKAVSAADLELLVRLSLAAGEHGKALRYGKHAVRAAAANHPGSPAPIATVYLIAEVTGDRELAERVKAAASGCRRSDCFRRRLGW